jgi:hypothetical protein
MNTKRHEKTDTIPGIAKLIRSLNWCAFKRNVKSTVYTYEKF